MRVHDISRVKAQSPCEPVSFGLFGQQQCRGSTQTLHNMYSIMRVIALCTDDPVRHFMYLPLRLQTVHLHLCLLGSLCEPSSTSSSQPYSSRLGEPGLTAKTAGLTNRRLCRGDRTGCSEAADRTEIPVVRIHVIQCTNSRDKCRTPQVRFLRDRLSIA